MTRVLIASFNAGDADNLALRGGFADAIKAEATAVGANTVVIGLQEASLRTKDVDSLFTWGQPWGAPSLLGSTPSLSEHTSVQMVVISRSNEGGFKEGEGGGLEIVCPLAKAVCFLAGGARQHATSGMIGFLARLTTTTTTASASKSASPRAGRGGGGETLHSYVLFATAKVLAGAPPCCLS